MRKSEKTSIFYSCVCFLVLSLLFQVYLFIPCFNLSKDMLQYSLCFVFDYQELSGRIVKCRSFFLLIFKPAKIMNYSYKQSVHEKLKTKKLVVQISHGAINNC